MSRAVPPSIQPGGPVRPAGPVRLAFVLSGGGALGSVQIGVLDALIQSGLSPDIIVGTSVGALNGAWLAAHPDPAGVRMLVELWRSLRRDTIFSGGRRRAFLRLLLGRDHLFTDKGIKDLVSRNLGDLTFDRLAVPFYVTATDIETGARS